MKRTGVSKPNLVAAAVRLAGGPGAAATICGVSRQTIYDWINERRVERLIDALRLSRASGVAIENLAGDDVEKLAAPVQTPRLKRRARKTLAVLRVCSSPFDRCEIAIRHGDGRRMLVTRRRRVSVQWPAGNRAVFVSLHDVDTAGFLRRRERDPLFRIEVEHQLRSTWFIPTKILNQQQHATDFLLESGNEVGWHGHNHDHRDHVEPFADYAVKALRDSPLGDSASAPTGMRLPRLLKSNYLFERLDQSCPALCYDTSFFRGIVPYYLWLNGKASRILEIPCTVPTDIRVHNQLTSLPRARKAEAILKIQIARTQKLIEAGAVISIVTHPEKGLSERPDLLDIYDQYLSYVRSCPDIWFATAGELFQYWSQGVARSGNRTAA